MREQTETNSLLFICGLANKMPQPIPTKKIPTLTVEQMEEIFMDRLADLIVRLLDHQHLEKERAKKNEYGKSTGQQ